MIVLQRIFLCLLKPHSSDVPHPPSLSVLVSSSSLAKLTEQLQATQGRWAHSSVWFLFLTMCMLSFHYCLLLMTVLSVWCYITKMIPFFLINYNCILYHLHQQHMNRDFHNLIKIQSKSNWDWFFHRLFFFSSSLHCSPVTVRETKIAKDDTAGLTKPVAANHFLRRNLRKKSNKVKPL